MSVLHELIKEGNDIKPLREQLLVGVNPNSQDDMGRSPLFIALMECERDSRDNNYILEVSQELISFEADVNLADNTGCTPLILATILRNCKIIDMLLKANAQIDLKDHSGNAALHYATTLSETPDMHLSLQPNEAVVKLLLKHHPQIDILNSNDETPLILAVKYSDYYIVRELLKKEASVNLLDAFGLSAMHYALDQPEVNVRVVLELRKSGCSYDLPDNNNISAKTLYFNKLFMNHPQTEVEKAKCLFKMFMLERNIFNDQQMLIIKELNKVKKCKLKRFLKQCNKELNKMLQDRISPEYTMYDIALSGAFGNVNGIPDEVFNIALIKLKRHQYPAYCDVIASGIKKDYLCEKFAEVFCRANALLANYELNLMISKYLPHSDLLQAWIAFEDMKPNRFKRLMSLKKRCTIL